MTMGILKTGEELLIQSMALLPAGIKEKSAEKEVI
jgi:hypothetical protein